MTKTKVIHPHNFGMRMPVWSTATMWLLLDRLKAPDWAWGVVGTVFFALWVVWITTFWTQVNTDIFAEKGNQ